MTSALNHGIGEFAVRVLGDQHSRRLLLHPIDFAVVKLNGEAELILSYNLIDRLLAPHLREEKDFEEAALTVRTDVRYCFHVFLPMIFLLVFQFQAACKDLVDEDIPQHTPIHCIGRSRSLIYEITRN